jgi:hypothetical protein
MVSNAMDWLRAGSWLIHHRVAALDFGKVRGNTIYAAQITPLVSQGSHKEESNNY